VLFINWHSKAEYIAPAFQILFAGGSVMIVKWNVRLKRLKYTLAVPVIVLGVFLAPLARPLLPVENFLAYQSALNLEPPSNEGHKLDGLPQFYADMFGWEDLARNISRVYQSLPEEERKETVVYCSNYGRAGAIEYYSKKFPLPKVVSPHNNYWYWWKEAGKPSTIIIIGGELKDHFMSLEQVQTVGVHKTKYAIPYENNLNIYIGRGFKRSLEEIRKSGKVFI
jgi:hypothetical protein